MQSLNHDLFPTALPSFILQSLWYNWQGEKARLGGRQTSGAGTRSRGGAWSMWPGCQGQPMYTGWAIRGRWTWSTYPPPPAGLTTKSTCQYSVSYVPIHQSLPGECTNRKRESSYSSYLPSPYFIIQVTLDCSNSYLLKFLISHSKTTVSFFYYLLNYAN